MQEASLFFGFPINGLYATALAAVNEKVYRMFVGNNGSYLEEIDYKSQRYLGKSLPTLVDSAELELLQLNIYSLLKKLVPDFAYEATPLHLLPLLHAK